MTSDPDLGCRPLDAEGQRNPAVDWGKADLVRRRSCPAEGRHGHPCGRQAVGTQVLLRKAVDPDPGSSPAHGDIISVAWEVLLFPFIPSTFPHTKQA